MVYGTPTLYARRSRPVGKRNHLRHIHLRERKGRDRERDSLRAGRKRIKHLLVLPIIKPAAAATWHLDSSLSPLFSFLFRRLRIAGDDSRCCYQFPKLTLPAPPLVGTYYFFFVVSDTPLPSFHRINKSGKLTREVGTERERDNYLYRTFLISPSSVVVCSTIILPLVACSIN